ncbi:hypothetical protein BS78_03G112000 [Paspalum vaginatum]|nr:hypothetical protein BS78_03G112000 [Paspalum vaginatum]
MQFHFIRPLHSMFPFLTSLTEACPRVLKPEEGVPALIRELREGSKYMTSVLEGCLNRLEWELSREQARQQAEDEIEQEQMQMPLIDSHDFAVVETIEFADDEHEGLPVPPTREEFKRRKTMENLGEEEAMELAEPTGEVETGMDEEEMQLVEEEIRAAQFEENGGGEQVKVAGDDEAPMRIVKNYKRPEEMIPAERDPTEFVVSPITGEHIPISEMGGNMCISLIDPKYKKQKEMMLARIKEKTSPDDEVSRNIVGLARTCPDVFRTTEEEVCNSVKAEIEKKKNEQPKQVIWDGRSGSIDWTATHGLSQPQGGEEQFDASSVDDGRPDPGPVPLVNVPRFIAPPAPYHVPAPGPHVPSVPQTLPHMHPPQQIPGHPLMIRMPGQMAHMPTSIPPPPGHTEFMPGPACSFAMPLPPHMLPMVTLNPIGIPWPPQPASEERPPLPDEPEHKRQRTDDASLIPAEQFLAHHPAETEKKRDEQPKQVIWDGDSGSIGQTATHASSPNQPQGGEEQFDLLSVYGRPVHGPAPLVQPGMPLPWPPQPPPLVNVPRFIALPAPYLVPPPGPRVPGVQIMPHMHPQQVPGQPLIIMMQSQMVHIPTGISPHPGHVQFMPGPPHPFDMPPPPHMLPMDNPIGIPQPPAPPLPPQPPEEQPPPPDEPEPKRQRIDDASLIPAEQFLAHHPGPASISVAVPNLDEGNLRGQVLQIPVQSLSDTIGGLKEHIAGELQLPANKQKLSLRTSFLKDNFTLAYYNVGPGVVILLTLKERGGRRKQVFPI